MPERISRLGVLAIALAIGESLVAALLFGSAPGTAGARGALTAVAEAATARATTQLAITFPSNWRITRKSQVRLSPPAKTKCSVGKWTRATRTRFRGFTATCTHPATSKQRKVLLVDKRKRSHKLAVVWTWVTPAPAADPAPVPTASPSTAPTAGTPPGDPTDYVLRANSAAPAGFITWNHCRAIDVAVNPNGYPQTEVPRVMEAIRRLAQASGLPFQYAGASTFIPTDAQPLTKEAGIEVVLALTDPTSNDLLAENDAAIGLGGMAWHEQPAWAIGGFVVIDAPRALQLNATPRLSLYMHELGHVAGLGHAAGRAQIMYPSLYPTATADWGAGDLAGLAKLGSVPCPED